MLRSLLSPRTLIGVVICLCLIIAGSLWYYWHVRRASKAEYQRSVEFSEQLDNKPAASEVVDVPTQIESADFHDRSDANTNSSASDGGKTFPDETDPLDSSGTFLSDDFVLEEAPVEDVRVSPHDFGAYPLVPADFPEDVNWSDYEEDLPIYELMTRVQIKLWEQGQRAVGISEENGLMYPIIRGTVYIRWNRAGTEIIGVTGHPSDMSVAVVDQIEAGIIPSGLTVLDYETSGIDPYELLGLDVPVSPYGFGAYSAIPEGAPIAPFEEQIASIWSCSVV